MVLIPVVCEINDIAYFEILVVLIAITFLFVFMWPSGVLIVQEVNIRDFDLNLFLPLICDFLYELADYNLLYLDPWWQIFYDIFEVHVEYPSDVSLGNCQLFVSLLLWNVSFLIC